MRRCFLVIFIICGSFALGQERLITNHFQLLRIKLLKQTPDSVTYYYFQGYGRRKGPVSESANRFFCVIRNKKDTAFFKRYEFLSCKDSVKQCLKLLKPIELVSGVRSENYFLVDNKLISRKAIKLYSKKINDKELNIDFKLFERNRKLKRASATLSLALPVAAFETFIIGFLNWDLQATIMPLAIEGVLFLSSLTTFIITKINKTKNRKKLIDRYNSILL